MANDAALVARMEVRLNTFEKQMQKAGMMAGDAVQDIEGRFARSNPSIAVGFMKGFIGTEVIKEGMRLLDEFGKRLKAIGETSKLTGMTANEVFALQQVLAQSGAGPEVVTKGLESLGEKLNEVRSKSNDLQELFEANGQKIKDAAGNVIPMQQALSIVADLVRNASTEFDKIEIAKLAGLSREWVDALEGGADALGNAQRAAAAASPDVEELVRKSKEFDQLWRDVSNAIATGLKNAFVEAAGGVAYFFQTVAKGFEVAKGLAITLDRQIRNDYDSRRPDADPEGPNLPEGPPLSFGVGGGKKRDTIIPSKGGGRRGGGGGGAGSDPERYFEDELRRMKERGQQLEIETRLIGANGEARAKALAVMELEQALQRGGVTITDAHRQKIEEQATAYAKVAAAAEQAKEQHRQMQELQQYLGREMVSMFSDLITGAATFEDAIKRLSKSLIDAALNALLLGQGPLAGLLGMSSGTSGGVGGIGGLLFGGFRASGGSVSGGRGYVVGERGPELFIPGKSGVIAPNSALGGGGSHVIVNIIDQTSTKTSVASTKRNGSGGMELILRDVEDGMAGRAARGRGSLAPALSSPAYRRG